MVQRSEASRNCQLTYVKKCFPGKCGWLWEIKNGGWTIVCMVRHNRMLIFIVCCNLVFIILFLFLLYAPEITPVN